MNYCRWSAPLVALALVTCSNGDDDPKPPGGPTAGIDAPAGVVVAEVIGAFGELKIENGVFEPPALDSRYLAVAVSPQGTPLLMGWIGPGRTLLSPRTTAEVLVFFASAAFSAPPDYHQRLQVDLETHPAIDPVAAAIRSALEANPEAFAEPQAAVATAIENAANAVLTHTSASRTQALVVNPPESKSGIRIDAQSGVNRITINNSYRRPAYAFVKRVSIFTEGPNGLVEMPSPAVVSQFDVPPVTGVNGGLVGTFTTLVTAAYGPGGIRGSENVAYVPKNAPPVDVPNAMGAVRTRYRVAVVGPGTMLGDIDQLEPEEANYQKLFVYEFFVKELLLPWFLNLIVGQSDIGHLVDGPFVESVIGDFVMIVGKEVPAIWTKAEAGDFGGALQQAGLALVSTGTFRDALLEAVLQAGAKLPNASSAGAARATTLAGALGRVTGAIDAIGTAFDSTAIGKALVNSSIADQWIVDVQDATISFEPRDDGIPPDQFQMLTANVVNDSSGDAYEYRYSTAGKFGTLRTTVPRMQTGNMLTSTSEIVFYEAGGQEGTDTVKVEVYAIRNMARVKVGEATATVRIESDRITLVPRSESLDPGTELLLAAEIDPPPQGQITFVWRSNGAYGTLRNTNARGPQMLRQTGRMASRGVFYDANTDGRKGSETVSVEIYDEIGASLGGASARISVGCDDSTQSATLRTWQYGYENGFTMQTETKAHFGFTWWGVEGSRSFELRLNDGAQRYGSLLFDTHPEPLQVRPFQPTGQLQRYYFTPELLTERNPRLMGAAQLRPGKVLYYFMSIDSWPNGPETFQESIDYAEVRLDTWRVEITPLCD